MAKAAAKANTSAAKAKTKAKAAAASKAGAKTTAPQKPKAQTLCRFFQKGNCKKADQCEFSHGKGSAAPATDSAKKEKRKEKKARKKDAKAAAAVETAPSAECPSIVGYLSDESS